MIKLHFFSIHHQGHGRGKIYAFEMASTKKSTQSRMWNFRKKSKRYILCVEFFLVEFPRFVKHLQKKMAIHCSWTDRIIWMLVGGIITFGGVLIWLYRSKIETRVKSWSTDVKNKWDSDTASPSSPSSQDDGSTTGNTTSKPTKSLPPNTKTAKATTVTAAKSSS